MEYDPGNQGTEAFLGLRLRALDQVINEQSRELLSAFDIDMPHGCVSVLQVISIRKEMTVTGLTAALNLSRQLVLQRLNWLENGGLVTSKPNPDDGRSRLIRLSRRGRQEANRLESLLPAINAAVLELNREIGVDLSRLLNEARDALQRKGLLERVRGQRSTGTNSPEQQDMELVD